MAKTNIVFNNKDYYIDNSSLSDATAALQSHLSTVMNGAGATINLGGTSYNIDSAKLSAAINAFVSHLGTVAGNGYKVVVNGVEYGISSDKVASAVGELEVVLGSFNTGEDVLAAGLYESGAIALYEAGDVEAASAMLKTSWDDLVANGVIGIGEGVKLPDGAELNEYGFCYGVTYSASMDGMTMSFVFNEDGSAVCDMNGEIMDIPAGVIIYSDHTIDMSALDFPVCIVSDDGASIDAQGIVFYVSADPKLPDGAELNEYGFCYGVTYSASMDGMTMSFVFNEDGSAVCDMNGEIMDIPAGVIIYSDHTIDMSALDFPVCIVSDDGASIDFGGGIVFTAGAVNNRPKGMLYLPMTSVIEGDLVVINDGSATYFEPYAFTNKTDITGIVIPDSITSIGDNEFFGCASLTNVVIPDSVTSIGAGAFEGCTSLTSVDIPDSVTSIGEYAFCECDSLTSIVIPDSVTSISEGAFVGCISLASVTIPDSVTSIGGSAFQSCKILTNITIPDSVTSIGANAFGNCYSLTSIIIPDGVPSIEYCTFSYCTSLTSVTIPDSVTSIGYSAFENCQILTNITIPDSVTSIGRDAFNNCTSLTSVDIPDSVTSIGECAFEGCTSLTSVDIPDSVTSIGECAFEGCTSLTSVIIPDSVTSIGNGMFKNCTSLANVTIGNNVTKIISNAFENCTSLTSIAIPNGVTSLYSNSFKDCINLTDIVIPDSIETSGMAFDGCQIKKLIIADGSKEIKKVMIMCRGTLQEVVIPDSVTSIVGSAFYQYTNLKSITFTGTIAQWNAIEKGYAWNKETQVTYVQCSDGQVAL